MASLTSASSTSLLLLLLLLTAEFHGSGAAISWSGVPYVAYTHQSYTWECGTHSSGPSNGVLIGMFSQAHDDRNDRKFKYMCGQSGTGVSDSNPKTLSAGNYKQTHDQTCDWSNGYAIWKIQSTWDRGTSPYYDVHDRKLTITCKKILNAALAEPLRDPAGSTDYVNTQNQDFNYAASQGRVIVGIKTAFIGGSGNNYASNNHNDRKFAFYTSTVQCDEGYVPGNDHISCVPIKCNGKNLANGLVTTSATGSASCENTNSQYSFHTYCYWRSCNSGYQKVGFPSSTNGARRCGASKTSPQTSAVGDWEGSEASCTDIDECTDGSHNCVAPAYCNNLAGSFECKCDVGPMHSNGRECVLNSVTVSVTKSTDKLTLALSSNSGKGFTDYKITLKAWRHDLSEADVYPGWEEKVIGSAPNSLEITGLTPGKRWNLEIVPKKAGSFVTQLNLVTGDKSGSLATTCGCDSSEITGKPTEVNSNQYLGRIFLKWKDKSVCESGFAFTRDNHGFSPNYEFSAPAKCNEIHEPEVIYDDLNLQPEEIYAPAENAPQPEFGFAVFYRALETTKRYAYAGEVVSGQTATGAKITGAGGATAQACADSCMADSNCKAFVTATTPTAFDCHHVTGTVRSKDLSSNEQQAGTSILSFLKVAKRNGSPSSSGKAIVDGTMEDCKRACSEQGFQECGGVFVAPGVCVWVSALQNGASRPYHVSEQYSVLRRLPAMALGSTHEYCIDAINPQGYGIIGYVSDQSVRACTTAKVQWESRLMGHVTLVDMAGDLPVKDVKVKYTVGIPGGATIVGHTHTGEDGEYEIHITTDQFAQHEVPVTLEFSKTASGGAAHQFVCKEGNTCNKVHTAMHHLRFDQQVTVHDDTSVPFTGNLYIATTADRNEGNPCGVKDAQVCLHDHFRGNVALACTETDASGSFRIPVIIGMDVEVVIAYMNHTIERGNGPSASQTVGSVGVYHISADNLWTNVNFEDKEMETVTIEVAGGLCNRTVGESEVHFILPSCPGFRPGFDGEPYTDVRSTTAFSKQFQLPAHTYSVHLREVSGRPNIQTYLEATNQRTQQIDMTTAAGYARFEYHPPPQLTIGFTGTGSTQCTSNPIILPSDVKTTATVTVREVFAVISGVPDIATCDYVEGVLDIENRLGESKGPPELTICHSGCAVSIAHDLNNQGGMINAHYSMDLMTGYPETNPGVLDTNNPHTKLFAAVLRPQGWDPVLAEAKVIVTGMKVISEKFSVPFPQYMPLAVVRDPPGDKSYTTLSNVETQFSASFSSKTLKENLYPLKNFAKNFIPVVKSMIKKASGKAMEGLQDVADKTKIAVLPADSPVAKRAKKQRDKAAAKKAMQAKQAEKAALKAAAAAAAGTTVEAEPVPEWWENNGAKAAAESAQISDEASTNLFDAAMSELTAFTDNIVIKHKSFTTEDEKDACFGTPMATTCMSKTFGFALGVASTTDKRKTMYYNTDPSDNTETSITGTVKWSLTTSGGSKYQSPGRLSDMYLVPSLLVIFAETAVITYDTDQCQARRDDRLTWSLRGPNNRKMLSWRSEYDIRNIIQPDLQRLLDQELELGDSGDASKIQELQYSIAGWGKIITQADEVYSLAESGGLKKTRHLVPTSLSSKAVAMERPDTGGEPAVDLDVKIGKIDDIAAVSFTGGGSSWKYDRVYSNKTSMTAKAGKTQAIEGWAHKSIYMKLFSYKNEFKLDKNKKMSDYKEENGVKAGTSKSTTQSIYFGDKDLGDNFAVEIYEDPYYDTFVYRTIAGRSKCPHEANTVQRESTRLLMTSQPLASVLPDAPAVYELTVTNDAETKEKGDYEIFTSLANNPDGLKLMVNGNALTETIKISKMPFGATKFTIEVLRGPKKYAYDPVTIGVRSQCDLTIYDKLDIQPTYLKMCSTIEWGGYLRDDKRFFVNLETQTVGDSNGLHKDEVLIVAYNKHANERKWAQDDRLVHTSLRYRRRGAIQWIFALDRQGDRVAFAADEDPYGYSQQYWDVSTLTDGIYELRLVTQCQASAINPAPDGLVMYNSPILTGRIDRQLPRQFSRVARPSSGSLRLGDEISVTFDEDINCAKPYGFQVSMTVGYGTQVTQEFTKDQLVLMCEQRTIYVEFAPTVTLDNLVGKRVQVTVSSVVDLVGNALNNEVSWVFNVLPFDLSDIIAHLTGLKFSIAYEAGKVSQYRDEIQGEVAGFLSVPESRIRVLALTKSEGDGNVQANIEIFPATSGSTTTTLAADFAAAQGAGTDPGFQGTKWLSSMSTEPIGSSFDQGGGGFSPVSTVIEVSTPPPPPPPSPPTPSPPSPGSPAGGKAQDGGPQDAAAGGSDTGQSTSNGDGDTNTCSTGGGIMELLAVTFGATCIVLIAVNILISVLIRKNLSRKQIGAVNDSKYQDSLMLEEMRTAGPALRKSTMFETSAAGLGPIVQPNPPATMLAQPAAVVTATSAAAVVVANPATIDYSEPPSQDVVGDAVINDEYLQLSQDNEITPAKIDDSASTRPTALLVESAPPQVTAAPAPVATGSWHHAVITQADALALLKSARASGAANNFLVRTRKKGGFYLMVINPENGRAWQGTLSQEEGIFCVNGSSIQASSTLNEAVEALCDSDVANSAGLPCALVI